jgi:hypothetical protein
MHGEEYFWKLEQVIDETLTGYAAAVKAHMPDCELEAGFDAQA